MRERQRAGYHGLVSSLVPWKYQHLLQIWDARYTDVVAPLVFRSFATSHHSFRNCASNGLAHSAAVAIPFDALFEVWDTATGTTERG